MGELEEVVRWSERLWEKCTMPVDLRPWFIQWHLIFTSEKSKTEYTIATNAKYLIFFYITLDDFT